MLRELVLLLLERLGGYLLLLALDVLEQSPAGVPHVAVNRSETPAVFMAARTDPNEQESVLMRPDLEAKVP